MTSLITYGSVIYALASACRTIFGRPVSLSVPDVRAKVRDSSVACCLSCRARNISHLDLPVAPVHRKLMAEMMKWGNKIYKNNSSALTCHCWLHLHRTTMDTQEHCYAHIHRTRDEPIDRRTLVCSCGTTSRFF